MCGFAGLLDLGSGGTACAPGLVEQMAATLAHRGPDDAASWSDPQAGVAFGFRRLAVLDLSDAGRQPMSSASGRYVIAFNGEVYNFAELRRQLESNGSARSFRGRSDTEVVLAAIEAWGLDRALARFVGMFAFALWDRHERRLHLVRDRLGVKPLYYARLGDTLAFASELRALRVHPRFAGEIDRGALALFLRHNYVPAPHTIFQGACKLPPGSVLEARSGVTEVAAPRRYWSLGDAIERGRREPFKGDPGEAAAALEEILADAVRMRLVSDVPLGVFLSGGVDSSLVAALAREHGTRPVRTFTLGFEEQSYDESTAARRVAAHLGTEHVDVRATGADALDLVPRLPGFFDEPFADSSQIPTALVCGLARRYVTVCLSGDGGDELFGGYARYLWLDRLWRGIAPLPLVARRGLARLMGCLPPERWSTALARLEPVTRRTLGLRAPGEKVVRLAALIDAATPELLYLDLMSHTPDPGRLLHAAREAPTLLADGARWPDAPDLVARLMAVDTVTYLPDDILVKVDRTSMAVGLEAREPLLDHRLVEFAWRLPPALRRGGKHLLRSILARHVPRAMTERPKKGFSAPVGEWLRGPLRDWGESLLAPARLREDGLFDHAHVHALWRAHLERRREVPSLLWNVLMFQAWHDAPLH